MTTPQPPLGAATRFGHYRLDRLIGRGGMGEVFEAYDTGKDRTVAIKVLPERLAHDPVYRERFRRESHAAARLKEPHVIPIHDYGEINGRLYLDMRLVDGVSLRALLRPDAPLAPERAVALIRQIASALTAAHADGLIHRDVKPDNILVTPDDFAYLADFGIAYSGNRPDLTNDGTPIGSFHYMAPERFVSGTVTPAADVYSLACVLYECLTGTWAYPVESDGELVRAHMFEPVPRPSTVRADIPPAFDAVVARGMAKDPRDRYGTAAELAAAAHAALTDRPPVAEPAPEPAQTHRPDALTQPSAPTVTELPCGTVLPGPAALPGGPESPGGPKPPGGTKSPGGTETPRGTTPPGSTTTSGSTTTPGSTETPRGTTPPGGTEPPGGAKPPSGTETPRDTETPGGTTPPGSTETPGGTEPPGGAKLPGDTKAPGGAKPTGGAETSRGIESPGGTAEFASRADLKPHIPRYVLALVVTVFVAAAAIFGVWTLTGRSVAGTAVADDTALRGADIDLLGIVGPVGYKRANCAHQNPGASAIAIISCTANPVAGDPAARFFRFRGPDKLQKFYRSFVEIYRTTSCPGDSPGADGPSIVDGKTVGRKACFVDRADDPNVPKPALILTSDNGSTAAIYTWATPADAPLRDYIAARNVWQFATMDAARDPDRFSPADRAVFAQLPPDFGPANCLHTELQAGPVNARVVCSTRLGYPTAAFFGFPDRKSATRFYQGDLGQLAGHACDGGGGPDSLWLKDSAPVGRFFCYPDYDTDEAPTTCLLAVHDDRLLGVLLCALRADDADPGPKNEKDLLRWFQRNFG
ncbi:MULTISPECIES: serine/threonine-protein kinase [unclassified Nocardia]|uniref:serine/threonine-protein kinase n=1 Tax=unclassified Nocardia TaxID=2637762 RepID=UPI00272E5CB4|nr:MULTISPECIES: serine/threonine-protein kinase [unclassified Nocardia]